MCDTIPPFPTWDICSRQSFANLKGELLVNLSRSACAALLLAILVLLSGCTAGKATPTAAVAVPSAPPAAQGTSAPAPSPGEPTAEPGGVELAVNLLQRPEGDSVALINGQSITWAEYEPTLMRTLVQYTNGLGLDWNTEEATAQLPSIQAQALDEALDRALIRQLAAEEGIAPTAQEIDDVVQQERQAILDSGTYANWEAFLAANGLTEAYFQRLVQDFELIERLAELQAPEREVEHAHVKHILVEDEATGQEVLDKLGQGQEWDALAAEYSLDTGNKDQGGDLGWFPRDVMVPAFEEAAFTLPVSSTSELVETDFGYHILWILDRGLRPMDDATWDMAKGQAFDEWFNTQRTQAEIEVQLNLDQPGGSSSP
jgi:parvulin-like peptidyl-prolyl isomerase